MMVVSDLTENCRWFSERGHRILPMVPIRPTPSGGWTCTCKEGPMCASVGNHPAMAYASDQPLRLPRKGENAGILIGADAAVLDVDNADVLERLDSVLGFTLPETLMIKTPRGMHFWFTAPRPFTKVLGLYPKVDLLTGPNGFVLGPGSCRPNKDTGELACYEWHNRLPMAPLPESLLTRAPSAARSFAKGSMAARTMKFYWSKVDEAVAEIAALQPGNRNGGLYHIAFNLFRTWQVVGADAIPYLVRAAVRPDFSEAEAARTVESARRAVYR